MKQLQRAIIAATLLLLTIVSGADAQTTPTPAQTPPPTLIIPPSDEVSFYGEGGPISAGVIVPPGRKILFTSGTVPDIADKTAKPGDRARYGDTKTQAISILKKFETTLQKYGLGLKDVIYLRAYLVPDPTKGNKMDFVGWSAAYGMFFNTKENPVKVARSTIAVAGLYDPDLLIEIEATVVFPPAPPTTR